ncbi:MAG TPA: hypothetical protein VMY05_04060 [Acidobacteriota bacterium]|nr:hypothetical protein [Acidobacteriota bacterium]
MQARSMSTLLLGLILAGCLLCVGCSQESDPPTSPTITDLSLGITSEDDIDSDGFTMDDLLTYGYEFDNEEQDADDDIIGEIRIDKDEDQDIYNPDDWKNPNEGS